MGGSWGGGGLLNPEWAEDFNRGPRSPVFNSVSEAADTNSLSEAAVTDIVRTLREASYTHSL